MKNKLIILTLILSCLVARPSFLSKPPSISVGMSETMGLWGLINVNYEMNIDGWSNSSNRFYMTAGVIVLPFLGGAGVGWRHNFNESRIVPFTTLTTFGTYALPIMCGTDNCGPKFGLKSTASLGLDLLLLKGERRNLSLQLGVIAQYDLANLEIADVSGNIPGISPVLNLKWGN